ncbi:MAG: response regulator [Elusimicrobiota bacterium]
MAQQSILVIDDDRTWHKLIGRFLEDTGYKVYAAATCADGVKLAEFYKPNCIVLDFHLTDGDAVSVCLAIKSNETIKKTPIIVFSSDPGAEHPAYTQCRADNFILKGQAAAAELPAAIAKILRPVLPAQSAD